MEIEKIPQCLRIANDVAPQKCRHESFHIHISVRFLVTINLSISYQTYLKSNHIRTMRNVAMRASIFLFHSLSQLLSPSESISYLKTNHIRTTKLIFPQSNKNRILWFLKQLNEHSLGPLMLVLDRTWHLKLVLTRGKIWKRNNVQCRIFIFGICSIPSCSNVVASRH